MCRLVCALALFVALSAWGRKNEDMPTLSWMGRKEATNATKSVIMKILREDKALSYAKDVARGEPEERVEHGEQGDLFSRVEVERGRGRSPSAPPPPPPTDNILVHGDNLEALHALLPFYAGQVKCIYIDPPYNTGSAFEHYDDNLEHATWLNMMYPRLKLLWDFLSEDGSIWISIDDDEQAYLKVLCDEIFGRNAFVTSMIWQKRTSPDMRAVISDAHDFVLLYAKNKERFKKVRNRLPLSDTHAKTYANKDNDPRGAWGSVDITGQLGHATASQFYEITTPAGVKMKPPSGRCWALAESTFNELVADNRIWFGEDGKSRPRKKVFLNESQGVTPWTWWTNKEVGHNQEAKKENAILFGNSTSFTTPKPERLIQRILTIASNPGDLVLDSFLGSGTTAAVAQKMGRRWIGIEMGEHAKTHCAVRLKKVIDGEQGGISKAVNWKGGGGFRFYELGEAILKKDGTLTEDIPFEVMAAHVWFTQTKRPFGKVKAEGEEVKKSTVLGVHEDVAFALLYNGILGDRSVSGGNVLTRKTLKIILDDLNAATTEEERGTLKAIVVYAEASRLSDETLTEAKIDFRQTPYDLVTRK